MRKHVIVINNDDIVIPKDTNILLIIMSNFNKLAAEIV